MRNDETLIDFIASIPWPFWLMIAFIVAVLMWILIFERDEPPQSPVWDKEAWNQLSKRSASKRSDSSTEGDRSDKVSGHRDRANIEWSGIEQERKQPD